MKSVNRLVRTNFFENVICIYQRRRDCYHVAGVLRQPLYPILYEAIKEETRLGIRMSRKRLRNNYE